MSGHVRNILRRQNADWDILEISFGCRKIATNFPENGWKLSSV